MSPPFLFGVGNGRLTRTEIQRRSEIAERHDAQFNIVHGEQGHCVCGHGCRVDTCPVLHYWFSAPNYGEPANRALARAVEADLEQPAR